MDYRSITDKPAIRTEPGERIHVCDDCLGKRYTNEPGLFSSIARCRHCGDTKRCSRIVKSSLVKRPATKRTRKNATVVRRTDLK